MRPAGLVTLLLAALLACSAAAPASAIEPEYVTSSNYKDRVGASDLALIIFTADYCTDCKDLLERLQEATDMIRDSGLDIQLLVGDLGADEDLKDAAGVRGVPSLSIIRDGKRSNYRGLRNSASQVAHYIKLLSGPAVRELATVADADKWMGDDNALHLTVAAFGDADADAAAAYKEMADALREDFMFFLVDRSKAEQGLLERLKLGDSGPALSQFQSWDKAVHAYEGGDWSRDAMEAFIRAHSFPPLPVFGKVWAKYINGLDKPVVRVVVDVESLDDRYYKASPEVQEKIDTVVSVRDSNDFDVVFTIAPASTHKYMTDPLGYGDRELLIVNKFGDPARYVFHYDWTKDHIYTWMTDWKNGRIRQWRKGAEAPADPVQNGVTTLVASTLMDVALDPKKDVLVEFYAPWCGHCKKLAPIWDELGKKFENVDEVVIAKIDGTVNEFDRDLFQVTGYPSIFFVPAGPRNSKPPHKYKYARDLETFVSFLDQMKGGSWSLDDTSKEDKKKKSKKSKKKKTKGKKKAEAKTDL